MLRSVKVIDDGAIRQLQWKTNVGFRLVKSSQVAFQCSMYRFWWLKWPWTTIAHYITQLAVHVEVTKDRPILSAAMR